jgi:type VII secretion protein EccE
VTVAAPAGAVVTAELVVMGMLAALAMAGLAVGWLVVVAVIVVVTLAAMVRFHGHTVARRALLWLHDRRPHDVASQIPLPVDVRRGDLVFGIQRDADTATAVIEVYGKQYEPTVAPGRRRAVTRNTLPLDVIADHLVQPGPLVLAGIDIVSSGSRVARAHGYPPVYSAVLQEQPAAGQRSTYAIVRLDLARSIQGLALRDTVENATAAVAERLVCALRQQGCRAAPLASRSVLEVIDDLAGSVLSGRARARSRYVDNDGSYWATYSYSPEDISTDNLNDVWSWRVDAAVTTITVSRTDDNAVAVRALVRTQTSQIPQLAPTAYLNPLPGQQIRAAMSCVPGATRLTGLGAGLERADTLRIPIGPAGILAGTIDDPDQRRPVLLPLTDPEHNTRIRVNNLDPDSVYLRQLLIRAAAVGHPITVYTDRPQRWAGLVDPSIEILQSPTATPTTPPTIVVKDRADGQPRTSAPTIVSLPTDSSYPKGLKPDIEFIQIAADEVRISTASFDTALTIASFPDEQPYLGLDQRQPAHR